MRYWAQNQITISDFSNVVQSIDYAVRITVNNWTTHYNNYH